MLKLTFSKNIKRVLTILLVSIITISYFTITTEADSEATVGKNVKLSPAVALEMTQELNFSATVEGKKETLLAAKMPGRIEALDVNIGDVVKKGSLLAHLEASDLWAQQNAAAVARANAASTLTGTNNFFTQKLQDVKLAYKSAKQSLENMQINIEDERNNSVQRLEEAKINVQMTKTVRDDFLNSIDQQEKNLYRSLESTITQSAILSNSTLSYLYSINNRAYTNGVSDFNISANFNASGGYSNEARLAILKFTYAANKLQNFYNEKVQNASPASDVLLEGRSLAVDAMNKGKEALQKMNTVVDDTSAGAYTTENDLVNMKNSIINYGTQLESMLMTQQGNSPAGLNGIEQSLNSLYVEKNNKLAELQHQIDLGKQKEQLLNSNNTSIENELQNKYKLTELQVEQQAQALATEKAQADLQLRIARAQLNSAGASLKVASVAANNAKVMAPYDSVIAEKYFDEGSVVNAGTPIFKVADMSSLKLVVFVPESQINLLATGVEGVAVSPLYADKEFIVKIERIAPQVDQESKKVRVEFKLEDPEKLLKLGMFMDVKVKTSEQPKTVIAVPLKAVQTAYDQSYVFVGEQGRAVRKTVKTGEIKDEYIEIIEGISLEDQVISEGFNTLKDGESYTVQQ